MSNKPSRQIIEQAIRDAIEGKVISEGPADFIKGVAGGIKGAAQVTMGNYRVNNVRSKVQGFADKTNKQIEKLSQNVAGSAEKMVQSSNPAVSSTGKQVQAIMKNAREEIQSSLSELPEKFPAAVSGVVAPKQAQAQSPQAQTKASATPNEKQHQEFNAEYDRLSKNPQFMEFVKKNYNVDNLDSFPRTKKALDKLFSNYQLWVEKEQKTAARNKEVEDLAKQYAKNQPSAQEAPKESLIPEKLTHKINFPSSIKSLVGESISKVFHNEMGGPAIPPPPPDDEDTVGKYLKAPGGARTPQKASMKAPLVPKSEKQTVQPPARKKQLATPQKESFSSMKEIMESSLLKDQILSSIQDRKKLSGKK
jgi:hypothetical protein